MSHGQIHLRTFIDRISNAIDTNVEFSVEHASLVVFTKIKLEYLVYRKYRTPLIFGTHLIFRCGCVNQCLATDDIRINTAKAI